MIAPPLYDFTSKYVLKWLIFHTLSQRLSTFSFQAAACAAQLLQSRENSLSYYELGTVFQCLGEMQRARTYFKQAHHAGKISGDLVALGCAERGLGDWHAAQDEAENAAQHWQAARGAFSKAGDTKAVQGIQQRLDSDSGP